MCHFSVETGGYWSFVTYGKICCLCNSGLIGLRWFSLPLSHHSNCHCNDGESCCLQFFLFFLWTLWKKLCTQLIRDQGWFTVPFTFYLTCPLAGNAAHIFPKLCSEIYNTIQQMSPVFPQKQLATHSKNAESVQRTDWQAALNRLTFSSFGPP